MNNESIDLVFIDDYLKNELNNEEINNFEERLKYDSDFKEFYLFIKSLKESVRKNVLKDKISLLKEYELSLQKQKLNRNKSNNLRVLFAVSSIAAVFLLLLFFVPDMMYFKNNNQISLEHFEPYPAHILKRGNQDNISKLKEKAYTLYAIADYKKASPLLAELCDSGDKESCFYAGVALLGDGEFEKALTFFEMKGLNINNNILYWYKGLCFWNKGKKVKAKAIWKEIDNKSIYKNKIEKILNHG